MDVVLPIGREVGTDTYRGIDIDREADIQPPEGGGSDLGAIDEEGVREVLELDELTHTLATL